MQNQSQIGGGLFGQNHPQQQQQQQPSLLQNGSSIFSSGSQQTPQQSGSLFGQNTAQPQQQTLQGGGLFTRGNQPAQAPVNGSLFGQSNQSAQTQAGGSLFGSFGGLGGQLSQPQQQPSGGLIGGVGAQQPAPQQPQQQPGMFFGMPPQPPQPQQSQPGNSLFASLSNGNPNQGQPQPASGLFTTIIGAGANAIPTTQIQPRTSFFSSVSNPGAGLGGSVQAPNQPSQTAGPGVKIDLNHARLTTRFTDLHGDLQREIEAIDALVLRQISGHHQVQGMIPSQADRLVYLPNDVDHVERRLKSLNEALESDAQTIDDERAAVQRDLEEAKLGFAAIDQLKMLPQHQYDGLWASARGPMPGGGGRGRETAAVNGDDRPRDLVALMARRAEVMTQTVGRFSGNIAEIESHLGIVEARTTQQMQRLAFSRGTDGVSRPPDGPVRELAGVLRDFELGIVGVANKVGTVSDDLRDLISGSESFLQHLEAKHRSDLSGTQR